MPLSKIKLSGPTRYHFIAIMDFFLGDDSACSDCGTDTIGIHRDPDTRTGVLDYPPERSGFGVIRADPQKVNSLDRCAFKKTENALDPSADLLQREARTNLNT